MRNRESRQGDGRGSTRVEWWRQQFKAFAARACTVEAFCRDIGETPACFYYWRRKLSGATPTSGRRQPSPARQRREEQLHREDGEMRTGFIPIRVQRVAGDVREVTVVLPSGVQVRVPVSAPEVVQAVIGHFNGQANAAMREEV